MTAITLESIKADADALAAKIPAFFLPETTIELRQASHSHHDRALLANALRDRGRSIKSDLTKTYRSNNA